MFISMFCKTSLLLTITFAAIATASPTTRSSANDGLTVPLGKRNVFTKADGVFDFEKAAIHIAHVRAKYRQNLINIKNNLGAEFLNEGYEIKPLANLGRGLEKRKNEPLTYHRQDNDFTGNISIGTPPQNFNVGCDTAFADLWVSSSQCTSCSHINKYSAKNSSTGTQIQGRFNISYADGTSAYGPIYKETVTVGGITVTNQSFSPVTFMSKWFTEASMDGILGLGLPGIRGMSEPQVPFFVNAVAQGQVSSKEFSMFLATDGSELYLGGTNPAKYSGEVEFHNLDTKSGFWRLGDASVHVGEYTMGGRISTIIDSGSGYIGGITKDVEAFYHKIPGAYLFNSTYGFYSLPFGEKGGIWNISAENFSLGRTATNSSGCIGAILAEDLGLGKSTWHLGDSFMKNVYSVFSLDRGVGFAKLVGNKA